jgi:hypothetical protein
MVAPGSVLTLISLSFFGYRNCTDEQLIAQARLVLEENHQLASRPTGDAVAYTRSFFDKSIVNDNQTIEADVPAYLESTTALLACHAHAHDDDANHPATSKYGESSRKQFQTAIGGQWSNGMIPSLIFEADQNPVAAGTRWLNWTFMPGPGFWRTDEADPKDGPPSDAKTTGIASLPIQGAVLHKLSLNMQHNKENIDFLCLNFPKVLEYHEYLFKRAAIANSSLVPIIHPWESPHSDLWGDTSTSIGYSFPLRRIISKIKNLSADSYTPEAKLAEKIWGPQHAWYREFPPYNSSSYNNSLLPALALTQCLRRMKYNDEAILHLTDGCPFHVLDVAFNSALLQSTRALKAVVETILAFAQGKQSDGDSDTDGTGTDDRRGLTSTPLASFRPSVQFKTKAEKVCMSISEMADKLEQLQKMAFQLTSALHAPTPTSTPAPAPTLTPTPTPTPNVTAAALTPSASPGISSTSIGSQEWRPLGGLWYEKLKFYVSTDLLALRLREDAAFILPPSVGGFWPLYASTLEPPEPSTDRGRKNELLAHLLLPGSTQMPYMCLNDTWLLPDRPCHVDADSLAFGGRGACAETADCAGGGAATAMPMLNGTMLKEEM